MDFRAYILSKFPNRTPNSNNRIHAICPFHDDHNPSFSINLDNGLFTCGSARCGVKGNFAYFYKLMEGIEDWREVFRQIETPLVAADYNSLFAIENRKKQKHIKIDDYPKEPFAIYPDNIEYLINRGIGEETIRVFDLKYGVDGKFSNIDINNTIIAPIYDLDGQYRTFQVRCLSPFALKRWNNPIGSPLRDYLYGGWAINGNLNELWIVEGASDVWNLHTKGIAAVGLFTKQASTIQLLSIHKLCLFLEMKPVICLDGDTNPKSEWDGTDFSMKIYNELVAFGLDPVIIRLNYEEDPGVLTSERILMLKNKFLEVIQ